MNFGKALEALKCGGCVSRSGWNGKGMFLFMVGGDNWSFTGGKGGQYEVLPFIAMKTADNKIVPWLCSQTDALADDWGFVQ